MSTSPEPTKASLAYRTATVRSVTRLSPSMTRVSFVGADLREIVDAGPDQAVKIFFPSAGQRRPQLPPAPDDVDPDAAVLSWYQTYLAMPDEIRPPMRTYTIRSLRAEQGELDVDFVVHGDDGPAAQWAQRAKPDDEVALLGPTGSYTVPEHAAWQLLAGDETALPAIGAIIENLVPGTIARAFIEVPDPGERQHFHSRGDVDVQWVPRGSMPHGQQLIETLHAADLPTGSPYAWVSGEASMVKYLRRHLVTDRGFDKRAINFAGYWRHGKSEEDTGREAVRAIESGAADPRGDTG